MRFLVPLALEAVAVRRGAPGLTLERVGMGPDRAKGFAASFVSRVTRPEPLAVVGVAGGLSSEDRPGDIIVASVLRSTDGAPELGLCEAEGVVSLLSEAGLVVRSAPVVSSPVIVHGQKRDELFEAGSAAVDMESYWLAALADFHPLVVVRVLLDVPSKRLTAKTAAAATRDAYRSLRGISRHLARWSPASVDRYPLTKIGES